MAATLEEQREIVEFGNNNHDILVEIVHGLAAYARDNTVVPDDVEWSDFNWDGQHRGLINVYYERTVPFETNENLEMSAKQYSNFITLISRGAEIYARTCDKLTSEVRISSWHWFAWNILSIYYV